MLYTVFLSDSVILVLRPLNSPLIATKNIRNTIMLQIMSIGLPTNVTHMGHANSPEEAAALIEKLLQPGAPGVKGTLPAPLKPGGDKPVLSVEGGGVSRAKDFKI